VVKNVLWKGTAMNLGGFQRYSGVIIEENTAFPSM
jgi:hypothetical protein